MKKYVRSALIYDDAKYAYSEEWDYDWDYIVVDFPAFTAHIDDDGNWSENGDEVYLACLNATIDNPTKISNAKIREDVFEKLSFYVDEKAKDLKLQDIEVSGEVLIEFTYPIRISGKHREEIDWDECEIESFDLSKVVIKPIEEE